MPDHPPLHIDTESLVIRCWSESDAAALREAIDSSLEHLRPWMPWAASEPAPHAETVARLSRWRDAFLSGQDFAYGVFDRDEEKVLGAGGLHRRVGPDGLEVGYWIRADSTRKGYATEFAHAVTGAGLDLPEVDRIEIHCDPNNTASRRIPERLGLRLIETRKADTLTSTGEPRDTLVFEVTNAEWSEGSA